MLGSRKVLSFLQPLSSLFRIEIFNLLFTIIPSKSTKVPMTPSVTPQYCGYSTRSGSPQFIFGRTCLYWTGICLSSQNVRQQSSAGTKWKWLRKWLPRPRTCPLKSTLSICYNKLRTPLWCPLWLWLNWNSFEGTCDNSTLEIPAMLGLKSSSKTSFQSIPATPTLPMMVINACSIEKQE